MQQIHDRTQNTAGERQKRPVTRLYIGCVQMNTGADVDANIAFMLRMCREAAEKGCHWVAFPENAGCMEESFEALKAKAHPPSEHPVLLAMQGAAREHGLWVTIGSLAMPGVEAGKLRNRGYAVNPEGEVVASYDKIHLFDADMTRHGDGRPYKESDRYDPGTEAKLVAMPWGPVGMTICYDVRFPHLYRALAKAGAKILLIPAAFAKVTGQMHWHVLLRARAIENGCYVIAPAQCGTHPGDRQTFGHALIIDPLGRILTDAGQEVGLSIAEIDLEEVEHARRALPCLQHDREFGVLGAL